MISLRIKKLIMKNYNQLIFSKTQESRDPLELTNENFAAITANTRKPQSGTDVQTDFKLI
jgi:hypothetical protein